MRAWRSGMDDRNRGRAFYRTGRSRAAYRSGRGCGHFQCRDDMTLTAGDIALYAGAMLILFITPGPVWVALLARAMSGGFAAAAPLALGVATGDILWPLLAVLG